MGIILGCLNDLLKNDDMLSVHVLIIIASMRRF